MFIGMKIRFRVYFWPASIQGSSAIISDASCFHMCSCVPGHIQLTERGECDQTTTPLTIHPLAALKALCQDSGRFQTVSWQLLALRGHMTASVHLDLVLNFLRSCLWASQQAAGALGLSEAMLASNLGSLRCPRLLPVACCQASKKSPAGVPRMLCSSCHSPSFETPW